MTKKVVFKLGVHDEKAKQKAMKAVSSLSGIDSLAMDMNAKKLTVVGDVDPVQVAAKLKKWQTEILTVGPAKEAEKKGEKDKAEKDGKINEGKINEQQYACYAEHYRVYSYEENPNSCVIC